MPLPWRQAPPHHCLSSCVFWVLLVLSLPVVLPPRCPPSCFHHQLIRNPPSPLDRVSKFLFCLNPSLFPFSFYCTVSGLNNSKVCQWSVGATSLFGVRCAGSCRFVRESSGRLPGSVIPVACHLGEVCHPSLVQLDKSLQAAVTVCDLYTLLNGARGEVVCLTSSPRPTGLHKGRPRHHSGRCRVCAWFLRCQAQVE